VGVQVKTDERVERKYSQQKGKGHGEEWGLNEVEKGLLWRNDEF